MVENNQNNNFLWWGEGEDLLRRDIRELPGSHVLYLDRGLDCVSAHFCIHFLKNSWNGVLKY